MRLMIQVLSGYVLVALAGCCASKPVCPPQVVDHVDIDRYMGKWYEIAKYPVLFQSACYGGTTAEYEKCPDGTVHVVNECHKCSLDGPIERVKGYARVVDPDTNAKLVVDLGWGEGDYWIIGLDDDYQWSIVSDSKRQYLWILSRTPYMDGQTYFWEVMPIIRAKGYDPQRLYKTAQDYGRSNTYYCDRR